MDVGLTGPWCAKRPSTASWQPERPKTAFAVWFAEHKDAFGKQTGFSGMALYREAKERWDLLSAEQMRPYDEHVEDQKRNHDEAREQFLAAVGLPPHKRAKASDGTSGTARGVAACKATVKSGGPKRPPSGYWLWQGENRDELTREAFSTKPTEIARIAGLKWRVLPDDVKAPYEERSAKLWELYREETGQVARPPQRRAGKRGKKPTREESSDPESA